MEDKRAVYQTDSNCNQNGCFSLTSNEQMEPFSSELEPLMVLQSKECFCNDPQIAKRLSNAINQIIEQKFRSKKFLRNVFGKKISCIANGVLIKTKIVLICNPNSNDQIPSNFNPKRPRRERVRRQSQLSKNSRMQ